jgi:hypothetical protein
MRLKDLVLSIFLVIIFPACSSLPYQDDTGFSNSSQANSPEFPIYIDNHLCKDNSGKPGLCSKRVKSTDTIQFHIDAQQYAYNLDVSCENPVSPPPSVSVPKGSSLDFSMKGPFGLPSFVCIGEVFPQDRPQPLSAKWEIRVTQTDAQDPVTNADLLLVGGEDCQDMDTGEGFCSVRTTSDTGVGFMMKPQASNYTLTVLCSTPVVPPPTVSVAAGAVEQFNIAPPFPDESFVCVGKIVPTTGSAMMWDVRVVVTDKAYKDRESIEFVTDNDDTYLVLGQFAKYSWVFDGNNWGKHSKDTMIKVDDPTQVKAYSESFEMRYNYLNMDAPVPEDN